MGIFDVLLEVAGNIVRNGDDRSSGLAPGPDKQNGGHDHRYNTGKDRTPSQKKGDEKRTRDD